MTASSSEVPQYWLHEDFSTLARIRAFEAVPLSQRGLPPNIYQFLMDSCAVAPDAVAIRYFPDATRSDGENEVHTFAQLRMRIHQTANLARSLGASRGRVVSFIPANIPQSLFTLWGVQATAIANPINWMLEAPAIAQIINSARSRILFAYGGNPSMMMWPKVLQVLRLCPQVHTLVRIGGDRGGDRPESVRFLDYDDVIDQFNGTCLDFSEEIVASDTASIYPTGGTTGAPKLARHTHLNEVVDAWLSGIVGDIKQGEARLSASPLFHVMAAIGSCLSTIARGGTLVLATANGWRDPALLECLWRVVKNHGISSLTVVPTVANQLIRRPVNLSDIASLNCVYSGSTALSEHVASEFRELTGITIREGYGMTETTSVMAINPRYGTVKLGSIGLPFPYHYARIVESDRSNGIIDCPAGVAGLLLVSGPTVFPGYLDESLNENLWVDGNWLDTGDLARIDCDGYMCITGRAKDLIIRGGHNIDPRTIEEMLQAHPAVLDVGVVGRPDAHAGEVPVAYVQLRPNSHCTAEELMAYSKEHLSERAGMPKDCYFVEALPKSAIGKMQKNILRLDATQRSFAAALNEAGLADCCTVTASDGGSTGISCTIVVDDRARVEPQVVAALAGFSTRFEIVARGKTGDNSAP